MPAKKSAITLDHLVGGEILHSLRQFLNVNDNVLRHDLHDCESRVFRLSHVSYAQDVRIKTLHLFGEREWLGEFEVWR